MVLLLICRVNAEEASCVDPMFVRMEHRFSGDEKECVAECPPGSARVLAASAEFSVCVPHMSLTWARKCPSPVMLESGLVRCESQCPDRLYKFASAVATPYNISYCVASCPAGSTPWTVPGNHHRYCMPSTTARGLDSSPTAGAARAQARDNEAMTEAALASADIMSAQPAQDETLPKCYCMGLGPGSTPMLIKGSAPSVACKAACHRGRTLAHFCKEYKWVDGCTPVSAADAMKAAAKVSREAAMKSFRTVVTVGTVAKGGAIALQHHHGLGIGDTSERDAKVLAAGLAHFHSKVGKRAAAALLRGLPTAAPTASPPTAAPLTAAAVAERLLPGGEGEGAVPNYFTTALQCDPTAPGGCNVCQQCCHTFVACEACVRKECTAPTGAPTAVPTPKPGYSCNSTVGRCAEDPRSSLSAARCSATCTTPGPTLAPTSMPTAVPTAAPTAQAITAALAHAHRPFQFQCDPAKSCNVCAECCQP